MWKKGVPMKTTPTKLKQQSCSRKKQEKKRKYQKKNVKQQLNWDEWAECNELRYVNCQDMHCSAQRSFCQAIQGTHDMFFFRR